MDFDLPLANNPLGTFTRDVAQLLELDASPDVVDLTKQHSREIGILESREIDGVTVVPLLGPGGQIPIHVGPGVFPPTVHSASLFRPLRTALAQRSRSNVLDLGFGAGTFPAIAFDFARHNSTSVHCYGIDPNPLAVQQAQENLLRLFPDPHGSYEFAQDSLFDAELPRAHVVVTNLPIWPIGSVDDSRRFSIEDGDALHARLIERAPDLVNPGGVLLLPLSTVQNVSQVLRELLPAFDIRIDRLVRTTGRGIARIAAQNEDAGRFLAALLERKTASGKADVTLRYDGDTGLPVELTYGIAAVVATRR